MAEIRARIPSKGRIVIPKAVSERLGLKTGDLVRFRLGDKGAVTIDKLKTADDGPFASFSEWTSGEDEKLYGGL